MNYSPFRYDYVGSFLRPNELIQARKDFENNKISASELHMLEDKCITDLITKIKKAGYPVITDGEFRRKSWHLDFMWGLNGVKRIELSHGYYFHGLETYPTSIAITGKITGENHPFIEHFKFVNNLRKMVLLLNKLYLLLLKCYQSFLGQIILKIHKSFILIMRN